MTEPRATVKRFVDALLRADAQRDASGGSTVIERVMVRLHAQLWKLIGSAGFDVLSARALVLARRDSPALTGLAMLPGGKIAGLDGARVDGDAAIVSHFLELLVTLIGEDLTMRLVRDGWPAMPEEENR